MFRPLSIYYADGYKVGHKRMLAPNTTKLYGTWIPRSLKRAPSGVKKILSFGQQLVVRWLHDEFKENFFSRPVEDAQQFAKDMCLYLGLPFDGKHFEDLHALGYLPVRIKSLPEGIETNPNIPHMTFVNTIDGYAWLTLYLETIISSLAWKPTTSATIGLQYRRVAYEWIMKTDPTNEWLIDYICHDFSARGLSPWDMLSSGLGHAISFRGSDTLLVIPGARYFYDEPKDEIAINSVNASEHSVSTTKIFTVGEQKMLADWLKEFDKGILSVVSDTFDLWQLITVYLVNLKTEIMTRDGKLVIRPDSGDPVKILTGYKVSGYNYLNIDKAVKAAPYEETETEAVAICGQYFEAGYINDSDYEVTNKQLTDAEVKGVIELLWDIFGGTINDQGYKVLDPHIGAIYGDSITLDRQIEIYERLEAKGFAATNIVLGVGSFTYQFNTRDTLGFAAKGAWFEVKTKGTGDVYTESTTHYDIYKEPVTDDGTKKSLKGLICVIEENGEYTVKQQCTWEEEAQGALQTIYEDGNFFNVTTLKKVREKINVLTKTPVLTT